jgi:O-antigen/teichoic acid export membrane protein
MTPFFPAAAEDFAAGQAPALAELTRSFGATVSALLALGVAGGCYWAKPFLTAWIGASYAVTGALVLQLLLIATMISTVAAIVQQATDAANVPAAAARSTVIGLVVSLALSVPLVHFQGAIGAAWGFLAGALASLAYALVALRAIVGASASGGVIVATLVKPALVAAVAYVMMRVVPAGPHLVSTIPSLAAGLVAGLLLAIALDLLDVRKLRRLRSVR